MTKGVFFSLRAESTQSDQQAHDGAPCGVGFTYLTVSIYEGFSESNLRWAVKKTSNEKNNFYYVGFEVFTAVVMNSILWGMTPCSLLSCNRRFGGTFCLPSAYLWFLLKLFLRPWRWKQYVPPKRRLKLNGLHCVISQKMILFLPTAVKTSNHK
jgi:hypothetical protein